MFLILDDLRRASVADPAFTPALEAQWRVCICEVHEMARRLQVENGAVVMARPAPRSRLRVGLSRLRKALRAIIKGG
jgi:hypothetical protein